MTTDVVYQGIEDVTQRLYEAIGRKKSDDIDGGEFIQLKLQLEDVRDENNSLKEDNKRLHEELQTKIQEINDLLNQLSVTRKTNSDLRKDVKDVRQKLQMAEHEIDNFKNKILHLSERSNKFLEESASQERGTEKQGAHHSKANTKQAPPEKH